VQETARELICSTAWGYLSAIRHQDESRMTGAEYSNRGGDCALTFMAVSRYTSLHRTSRQA
jgi:hypothetical protein